MSPSSPGAKSPARWTAATVLLLAAVIAAFWVPFYARTTPKLGPFPFFYWYQLVLVPVVAVVSWLAYLLLRDRPGDRAAAGGGQPPDGTGVAP
ncbi:MAG TPA: DUF3311 domain-containing protein [Streptosporangiaceae bacterium]|nr:DUF3311 domain-containing protein [Streptosporangiaceae bacterium]